MGQYFNLVLSTANDDHINVNNSVEKLTAKYKYYNFLKFTEETAWLSSEIAAAAISMAEELQQQVRITAVGDYAWEDGYLLECNGFTTDIYENSVASKALPISFVEMITPLLEYHKQCRDSSSKEAEYPFLDAVQDFVSDFVIINEKKHEYVDLMEYSKQPRMGEFEIEYNPLTILCATEQGLGGGDLSENLAGLGRWVGDYLTVIRQANKPDLTGFKNITFDDAVWSVIDK